jgi:hypothetical protein
MDQAIDTWDGAAYLAPFARSDSLVFIGSDSSEVTLGYDALASEILPSFASAREGGRSGAYRHTGLRAGASRDGRVGWWLQEMDYEFERGGERRVYPFRISGLALRDSIGWRIVLAHASLPVEADSLHRLRLPPGTRVSEPTGPATDSAPVTIRGLLDGVVALHGTDGGGNPVTRASELLASPDDVLIVGEGPHDVALVAESGARLRAGFRSPDADPVPARLRVWSRDNVAWWYQTGVLRSRAPGDTTVWPYRATGAAIRDEGRWKILEWHADIPVPNDSTHLFSRPAAAADAR